MENFEIMTANAFSIANILNGFIVQTDTVKNNKRFYYIPIYQRQYSWRKDVEIKKLISDLEYFWSTSKSNENKSYFLGNVVIKRDDEHSGSSKGIERYSVIDGQQRLTTFYLFVSAIYKKGIEQGVDPDKLNELKNMVIVDEDNKLLKFVTDEKDSNLESIKNDALGIINDFEPNDSNHQSNYVYIKENAFNVLKFDDWFSLIKRIKLSMILLGNDDDEIAVFESINSDGLKLGIADLIKAYLFLLAEREEVPIINKKDIEELYKELSNTFEKVVRGNKVWDESKIGIFITSVIQIISKDFSFIKNDRDTLYRSFKDAISTLFKSNELNNKVKFINLINDVRNYLKSYNKLQEKKINFETGIIKNEFSMHHVISSRFDNYLTILLLLERIDKSEKLKVYELLDLHLLNTSVSNDTKPGKNNKFLIPWLNRHYEDLNYENLKEFLLSGNTADHLFNWDEFKLGLKQSDFYKTLKPIAKYIFYRIENHLAIKNKSGNFIGWEYDIDHLMSQKKDEWPKESYNEEYYLNNLNSLRNLTILKPNLNSKIGKDAWGKKSEKLKLSKLQTTEKLIEITKDKSWTMIKYEDSVNKEWLDWITEKISEIFDTDLLKSIERYDESQYINIAKKYLRSHKKVHAIPLLAATFIWKGNRHMTSKNVSRKLHELVENIINEDIDLLENMSISMEMVDKKGNYMSERLGTFTINNNQLRQAENPIFVKDEYGNYSIEKEIFNKILKDYN